MDVLCLNALKTCNEFFILNGLQESIPNRITIFLISNWEQLLHKELQGKKLARAVIKSELLTTEISNDFEEIANLNVGWCDGKDEHIPEEAYTVASLLLLLFALVGNLPSALIPSPLQTIDFRFGDWTLLIDGSLTLLFFNQETGAIRRIILTSPITETDLQLLVQLLKINNASQKRLLITFISFLPTMCPTTLRLQIV